MPIEDQAEVYAKALESYKKFDPVAEKEELKKLLQAKIDTLKVRTGSQQRERGPDGKPLPTPEDLKLADLKAKLAALETREVPPKDTTNDDGTEMSEPQQISWMLRYLAAKLDFLMCTDAGAFFKNWTMVRITQPDPGPRILAPVGMVPGTGMMVPVGMVPGTGMVVDNMGTIRSHQSTPHVPTSLAQIIELTATVGHLPTLHHSPPGFVNGSAAASGLRLPSH